MKRDKEYYIKRLKELEARDFTAKQVHNAADLWDYDTVKAYGQTVFVLWRIQKDFGESATKELAGIFLTKDDAEYAGKSFWSSIEEVETGRLLI